MTFTIMLRDDNKSFLMGQEQFCKKYLPAVSPSHAPT